MSCPREPELMRYGDGALDPGDARSLERHVAGCDDCREALSLLREAKSVLATPARELAPEARARMWRSIQAARATPEPFWSRLINPVAPWQLAWAAGAAAAVVLLMAALATWPGSPPNTALALTSGEAIAGAHAIQLGADIPRETMVRAKTASLISGPGIRIAAEPAAELTLNRDPLERSIILDNGALDLDVEPLAPGYTLVIMTPAANIEVIGTRLRVTVDRGGTFVQVASGVVRVAPLARAAPPLSASELRAGESRRIALATSANIGSGGVPGTPVAQLDPAALARAADTLRRSGRLLEAAEAYAQLASDPRAEGYIEEAELRRALIFRDLGRIDDAREELRRSGERFPNGVLAPERALLSAALFSASGAHDEARQVLRAAIRAARDNDDREGAEDLQRELDRLPIE